MNVHITLLGKELLPLYYPVKQYKPEIVYIIGTKQNKEQTKRLVGLLTQKQEGVLAEEIPHLKKVSFIETDAYDFEATYRACMKIHENHSDLSSDSFMYNLTGGTKIMALAAFAVASDMGSKAIYTDSASIKIISKEQVKDIPLDCRLILHEIVALQGQKLLEAVKYDRQSKVQEVAAAQEICNFIRNRRDVYNYIRQWLDNYQWENGDTIPNHFACRGVRDVFVFHCGQRNKSGYRTLTITNNDREELLKISCEDPKALLLRGMWWEVLVAASISSVSKEYVVWQNVKFKQVKDPEGNMVKNEIDILVNIGNKLLFVECKSGKFDSANLHKCGTVKSTYGGEKSKVILVSAAPADSIDSKSLLHENASDNSVSIISPSPKQGYAADVFLSRSLPDKVREIINALPL